MTTARRFFDFALSARFVLLFAVALLPLGQAARAETASAIPYGQGILWEVSRDGAAPSHVFGTIHLSDPRVLALPPAVSDSFAASRTLAVELDVTPQAQVSIATFMIIPPPRTLDQIVGAELFERFTGEIRGRGLPVINLKHVKPWAAAVMLAIPKSENDRRAEGAMAMDLALQADARKAGIRIVGLEQVAEQLGLFDQIPEDLQVEFLRSTLDQSDEIKSVMTAMVDGYLARDLSALYGIMLKQMAGQDRRIVDFFRDHLIDVRNKRMADRAEPLFAEGGAFVAVGALHLPGAAGVLSLLAERGYAVKRIY